MQFLLYFFLLIPHHPVSTLFPYTTLFRFILLAVVHNQPKEMGLVQAIQHFIDHRVEVVRRRTAYLLQKARDREHILEGYKIALDNLDAVIKIIRASGSRQEAKENLLAASFKVVDKLIQEHVRGAEGRLTPKQADAILELQLYRLTRLSADEILKELAEIREKITEYEAI